jgi:hypothetical protein
MSKPSKAQKIRDYMAKHPDKTVKQVASALRVIPAYVYKVKSELKPAPKEDKAANIEQWVLKHVSASDKATADKELADRIPENARANALDIQVGGAHYKNKRIQPVEFSYANNLNGLEASIVKRITRWRDKDGFQDLEKIKHEVDLLIELETMYGNV